MLFWAFNMRKVDGWKTLATKPIVRVALELKVVALSISWRFCADSAPADLSFHLWIAFYGCCSTGFGLGSSTRWYWSSPQR
jgi:hypothetical protein